MKDNKSSCVPMRFYKFYIWVRLPLIVLFDIFFIISNGIDNAFSPVYLIEILTIIFAFVGLVRKKYWGYMINKIFIIAKVVIGFIFVIFGINGLYSGDYGFFLDIGIGIVSIVINILIYIYFENRQYLFKGTLKQHADTPICTHDADTCLIRILHLNGTASERIGNTGQFNFNCSKFIDDTGTIYFREEVRNGQIVNVVTTKEKWLEAVTQNSGSKRNTTYE